MQRIAANGGQTVKVLLLVKCQSITGQKHVCTDPMEWSRSRARPRSTLHLISGVNQV
jgi:hypothetical protein